MLGLGTGASTSSPTESKYSLSLDGIGDFIELGYSDDIISRFQANVTLMCWLKPQEEASNQYIFSNKRDSSSSNFSLRLLEDSGIKFNGLIYTGSSLGTTLTSTTTITAGTWYHVAITAKANEQKIYINGQLEHTVTLGFNMAPSATDECTIGSFGSSFEYEGLISELAIFNAYLTGQSVLAAYNSGFDLKTNVGDYTNSSDITHYYKMGNGSFDDKANGVVHDQDNPGFGAEMVQNGSFDNGTTNWTKAGTTSATQEIVDGALKMYSGTADDNANSMSYTSGYSMNGVSGKTYRLRITASDFTEGGVGKIRLDGVYLSGAAGNIPISAGTQDVYFVAYRNFTSIKFFGSSHSHYYTIDDVSLRLVNGNPGITSGGPTFSSDAP